MRAITALVLLLTLVGCGRSDPEATALRERWLATQDHDVLQQLVARDLADYDRRVITRADVRRLLGNNDEREYPGRTPDQLIYNSQPAQSEPVPHLLSLHFGARDRLIGIDWLSE